MIGPSGNYTVDAVDQNQAMQALWTAFPETETQFYYCVPAGAFPDSISFREIAFAYRRLSSKDTVLGSPEDIEVQKQVANFLFLLDEWKHMQNETADRYWNEQEVKYGGGL